MNNILNYINQGKGFGTKYLLIFAFIISIVSAISMKIYSGSIIPELQSITDQLLPIRVENGVIVEPKDTFKVIESSFGEEGQEGQETQKNLKIILNTNVDEMNLSDLPNPSFYLTRKMFYGINNQEIRSIKLSGNSYLPQGDYTDLFKKIFTWTCVISVPFMFVILFAFYFIMAMFYSLFTYIIARSFKKNMEYDQRMRLSTTSFITTSSIFWILSFVGYSSYPIFFVAIIGLQILLVKNLPEKQA